MSGIALKAVVAVSILAALALFAIAPAGAAGEPFRAAAVAMVAISLWSTASLSIGLTALVFVLLAILAGVPLDTVFAGFQSSAFWLVFGGIVVGVAVRHTGLGDRIVGVILAKLPRRYWLVLTGIALAAAALAFVMPSTFGRVVLLMPIITAMADRLGFAPGSNGRSAMVLTAAFTSFLPAGGILPALVPGVVMAGAAETLYGITIGWGEYFIVNTPVGGLVRGAMVVALMVRLFPAEVGTRAGPESMPAATRPERFLGAILLASLALWCTDTLHGISPGWVGLGAAIVCLWPGLGLVPAKTLNSGLDVGSLFYVVGVLGMGAMISGSGLADALAGTMLTLVPLGAGSFQDVFALHLLAIVLAMFVTSPALPAVLTPLADTFANATGLPVFTVLMTQVIGFSNVILPYQAAPIVVALAMGGVGVGPAAKATLLLTALTILIVLPLTWLWWVAIGLV
jgi:di/tricarboxylate transporter